MSEIPTPSPVVPGELLSPQLPELYTVAQVEAFLDTPLHRNIILARTARIVANDTRYYLSTAAERAAGTVSQRPLYDLNQNALDILFDPALATIVIDATGRFAGSELVAIAAQQQREKGKPSCNVILMPSATNCASVVQAEDGRHYLEVTHGLMLDTAGNVYAGELPQPVRADMVETINMQLLQQCADKRIPTLNDPAVLAACNTKSNSAWYAEKAGFQAPGRFTVEEMWQQDPADEFVIKPAIGSQGRGVRIFSGVSQKEAATAYYDFLHAGGYRPVIEQRVRSYPLRAKNAALPAPVMVGGAPVQPRPATERRDWNVRAIIANGALVDMYMRTDDWGKTVNRSTGAGMVAMRGLANYTDDPTTATRLFEQLLTASNNLAKEIPTGIAGVDITVDEAMQPFLYEINMGNTGGMQTIALLHDHPELKLMGSKALLEGWLRQWNLARKPTASYPQIVTRILEQSGLGALPPFMPRAVSRQPIARDVSQLAAGLALLQAHEGLGRLPEDEIRRLNPTPHELGMWVEAGYQAVSTEPVAAIAHRRSQELDATYLRVAPLEFGTSLARLAEFHNYPTDILPHLEVFEKLFPNDPVWDKARMTIASTLDAPHLVFESARQAITNGAKPESVIRLALMSLVYNAYIRFGKVPAADDADPYQLMSCYVTYSNFGYGPAAQHIQSRLSTTTDQEIQPILAMIGLELAMADGDNQGLEACLQAIIDCHREQPILEMLEDRLVTVAQDRRQLAMLMRCCVRLGGAPVK